MRDPGPKGPQARQQVARQVRAGVTAAAPALADLGPAQIPRLQVRLPQGAGQAEIARAVAEAVRRRERGRQ